MALAPSRPLLSVPSSADELAVDQPLVEAVEADEGVGDLAVDVARRRPARPCRRSGRRRRAARPPRARRSTRRTARWPARCAPDVEDDLDLDGRVAARVEDLPSLDQVDTAHRIVRSPPLGATSAFATQAVASLTGSTVVAEVPRTRASSDLAQTSRRRWRPDGSCAYASNVVPRYRKDLLTAWPPSPTLRLGPGLASARCHACSTAAITCARRRAPRFTRPWRRWAIAPLDPLLAAGPSVRGSSACSFRTSTSRPRTSVCAASCGRCNRTASRSCCTTSTRPIAPVDDWWNFHGSRSMG